MSWHCTVVRAHELFVLRMPTLAIQYSDPWGKSAIPNKENSPPCPGWGEVGANIDRCIRRRAQYISGRSAMHLYIMQAIYFKIYTTIIQLMSIAGYEAYVCVCFFMYKTVCAAFIWLPWDARSCPYVCLYCVKKLFNT